MLLPQDRESAEEPLHQQPAPDEARRGPQEARAEGAAAAGDPASATDRIAVPGAVRPVGGHASVSANDALHQEGPLRVQRGRFRELDGTGTLAGQAGRQTHPLREVQAVPQSPQTSPLRGRCRGALPPVAASVL